MKKRIILEKDKTIIEGIVFNPEDELIIHRPNVEIRNNSFLTQRDYTL